jgi:Family of unknown function (DUF6326)
MEDVRIILSASWVALMLTYLLGDVLRIYSGDFAAGKVGGIQITGNQWLGVAILMVTPIFMVFLSLTLNYPVIRWANIIVAIVFLGFNLIGLPSYPSAYDKFLILVGLGFNVLTVWYAWQWTG